MTYTELESIRNGRGYTKEAFAPMIGLSLSHYYKLKNQRNMSRPSTILATLIRDHGDIVIPMIRAVVK